MKINTLIILLLFSFLNIKAQTNNFLDSIKTPENKTGLFLRTFYYDNVEEGEQSPRKRFENGIDMRRHYYTDNSELLDSISKLWSTDNSNFTGCFCGYDFEIFLYTGDSLIKKMKYVFCCEDFVINKVHLSLPKDKMSQSIRLMTPIENIYLKEYIKKEWVENH